MSHQLLQMLKRLKCQLTPCNIVCFRHTSHDLYIFSVNFVDTKKNQSYQDAVKCFHTYLALRALRNKLLTTTILCFLRASVSLPVILRESFINSQTVRRT